METIYTLLMPSLKYCLELDGVLQEDYRPAYDGESVGLDLYNAGPRIVIPGIDSYSNYYPLDNARTWLEATEHGRKTIFKKLIPTGLKTVVPRGYGAFIYERGSVTKTPLMKRAGVIDPGYTGEIFINAVNLFHAPFVIEAGAKTPFQLIVQKVSTDYEHVDDSKFEELAAISIRQEGQIGSSD